MEIFDLYDSSGNRTGNTIPRGTKTPEDEYHLVVHIWIRNNEGKYLVQKRNKATDSVPGQYAATGGAVTTGEDSITGALRETEEEIGIQFTKEQMKLVQRYYVQSDYSNYITDLYLVEENVLLSDLKLDYNEVSKCEYFAMDEIRNLVKENMFWDYENHYVRNGYFDLLEKS